MEELKHGAHECVLTTPEIVANGICNMCYKDEPVAFFCDPCNFDLCQPCSKLPLKVSHDFHSEHPLEFCDHMKKNILCHGCGDLFSGSYYYKCKKCEIYLHLGCAILNNINPGWDAQEMLHYSHAHLLRRCKPGTDGSRGSCLMCELPLTPSAICYGCVRCYEFVHERCLNLPREIQHPVHPAHPLLRLDFTHTCGLGRSCDACGLRIDGSPLGCPECNFNLHLRCADSLLRGLMDKHHHHKLFYVTSCGVCETKIHPKNPAYCCKECDFVGHLECFLHEEAPRPFYLKELYGCDKDLTRPSSQDDRAIKETENKIVINDLSHNHVLIFFDAVFGSKECSMCYQGIDEIYWECEKCAFTVHDKCVKLSQQSRYQFHSNHPLTLLPSYPAGLIMNCDVCKEKISAFNLFCRICSFIICTKCMVRANQFIGELSYTHLPKKVSHDFHPDHPFELYIQGFETTDATYKLCSGCGSLFSTSLYYTCKLDCDIYLDLGCAILSNINMSWYAEELLHYSHAHLLRKCKPGPDGGRVSCLMCELPLTPFSICFGCVTCYLFVHERCLNLRREIQHPVHPSHPLIRLDFTKNCGPGQNCDACGLLIDGAPLGCQECNFKLHLRCADSLLRCISHVSPEHFLFYRPNGASKAPCPLCKGNDVITPLGSYYHCMACDLECHFECVWLPQSIVRKSHHIHPLFCNIFLLDDNSMEYCDVCETILHTGHHVYSCKDCDFRSHIECILHGEMPFPLYLKDLYSCSGENVIRPIVQDHDECETIDKEKEILVTDIKHTHVMTFNDFKGYFMCGFCDGTIHNGTWVCKHCGFMAHDSCLKITQQSRYRFHSKHPLTLLPSTPGGVNMRCDTCKEEISSFNLLCRICNLIICTKCVVRAKECFGELQRGQKFIAHEEKTCFKRHMLIQVMISISYMVPCTICNERLFGKVVSCKECEEIYHFQCIKHGRLKLRGHPLHDHKLNMRMESGSGCTVCKLDITKYAFSCFICPVRFHLKCIEAVGMSKKIECDKHYLYNFWSNDSGLCTVCNRLCGASFYGCINCNINVHVECVGFPTYVKNQRHQHTVILEFSETANCSLCGMDIDDDSGAYSCCHCEDAFHAECMMSTVEREAATEEEQISDIYLMYIEQDLLEILKEGKFLLSEILKGENLFLEDKKSDEEGSY